MANREKLLLFVVVLLAANVGLNTVRGAGECGKTPVEKQAEHLSPCVHAGRDEKAHVSSSCCLRLKKILLHNPACMCAVMRSRTVREAGIRPEAAATIPKRCNLTNMVVGFKCGAYTMP
ncbi:unnamed protein product [Victoria cruziana]